MGITKVIVTNRTIETNDSSYKTIEAMESVVALYVRTNHIVDNGYIVKRLIE